jgi:hypothetical protein
MSRISVDSDLELRPLAIEDRSSNEPVTETAPDGIDRQNGGPSREQVRDFLTKEHEVFSGEWPYCPFSALNL